MAISRISCIRIYGSEQRITSAPERYDVRIVVCNCLGTSFLSIFKYDCDIHEVIVQFNLCSYDKFMLVSITESFQEFISYSSKGISKQFHLHKSVLVILSENLFMDSTLRRFHFNVIHGIELKDITNSI